jgi:hypothetical protein
MSSSACPNGKKETSKCLKALERVEGIEPSYSAWKAAALPLSYTRAAATGLIRVWRGDQLTRPASGLNTPAASARSRRIWP